LASIASLFALVSLSAVLASPTPFVVNNSTDTGRVGKRCTGTINSLSDVAAAQECTTIVINAFTVPAGETFTLSAPAGAEITMAGTVTFGVANWAGPLFKLSGTSIIFNGNGHTFDGNGPSYWDGLGGNGGVTKPAPMLVIDSSGTFENTIVKNSPTRAVAINGNGNALTVSAITVDNSAGDAANSKSNGAAAGANTDGFDVAGNNIRIQNSIVKNQDDCLAINRGVSITFTGNQCSGGHGISIGSISSSTTVSNVVITNNVVTNSDQALRIKTDATATGSTVNGVTYTSNTGSGMRRFGVIIDQSYPSTLGTPGTGVVIEGVDFTGGNSFSVNSGADRVEINCGSTTSCPGTWTLAGLTVTGGSAGVIKNAKVTPGSY